MLHGPMPIYHEAIKGGYTGRHWPTPRRASSLLDAVPGNCGQFGALPIGEWSWGAEGAGGIADFAGGIMTHRAQVWQNADQARGIENHSFQEVRGNGSYPRHREVVQ